MTSIPKTVVKCYGNAIEMKLIPENDGKFTHFVTMPNQGLLVSGANGNYSAAITTFGNQGGSARVITAYGTCEPRG